ncbi:MAG: 4,5-dihydroxyphthalate decarboxylase [Acidobacteria bacterium RIFCSPLOWO2_12_FULL_59_11]|nr:MAG: 4,5-dihydroxyphthalate decarboxylase [Acidobacteria bacterium RIFCSPLOWO2_12_FULL_59_11]
MRKVPLTVAVKDYDRTKAIFSGLAPIEGCDVVPLAVDAEECFHRAIKFQEFDVSELSLSSYMVTVSRGENAYIGIPAFVSRVFRHSGIYIRTDRGINKPEDLRGRTVGVPEYQITANVWIRGMLKDDFGIKPDEIHWRRGGIEQPGRDERSPIKLPPGIDLQQVPDDKTLSGMLENGEIDAMMTARTPSCFDQGVPNVGRLYPDFKTVEQDYFRRTGFFPIMHLIGIRKILVEQYPWLPVSVYKAFLAAKNIAIRELNDIGQLMATLPWAIDHYNETRRVMGEDFWPYGLKENLKTLEAFARYHHEQGLSVRKVAPEELFAPSTLDLSKI